MNFDKQHLWHPYSAIPAERENLEIISAHGCKFKLSDGRELIDGMSSWWTAIHGYNHPELNKAAKEQIDKFSHVMFGGLTHQPAIELGKALLKLLPKDLDKIFYCDSGSISIEVAMKMAIQYWNNLGQDQRNKFVTFRSGYHGDTLHAMSVCDPVNGMHSLFSESLPKQLFVTRPEKKFNQSIVNEVEALLKRDDVAAFICEPIVQGAGGMRFYDIKYLEEIKKLCTKHDVLLIFDEIATGFGRTGELFISNKIQPDILCIGKALTAGYLTLAATITTEKVSNTVKTLMHGPTFMANALACSIAKASIELLEKSNWRENVKRIEKILLTELKELEQNKLVKEVRILGAIGVIELADNLDISADISANISVDVSKLQESVVSNGVWLRPFRNLLYTMPPFIIEDKDLKQICKAIKSAIKNY